MSIQYLNKISIDFFEKKSNVDRESNELLTQTIFVKSTDKLKYDLEVAHAQQNPLISEGKTFDQPTRHSIKTILQEDLCGHEFFMAKPWSSCLENEFYEDFKVTFSKEEIIWNEQTCILMIV